MTDAWLFETASNLGRGIEAGEIDPIDLANAYLDAAKNHEHSARIYSFVTEDRAMAESEAASKRAKLGVRRSLLDGVPISWKDLFDTAGTPTEGGTRLLKGRVPGKDATVISNATQAGLVCIGKTHLSELAFSGLGLNPMTATSPCVHDAGAVAGGSSSGAASSIAHGLAAAGIGSDTGGSVRIPAAWNDLVGLKTTIGRIPVGGTIPLCKKFDTIGPLTRSVEDAAELLAVLGKKKATDLRHATLKCIRLAVLRSPTVDGTRDQPAAAFTSAVSRLNAAGAHIEDVIFEETQEVIELSGPIIPGEAYAEWGEKIEANPDAMYHEIRTRFRGGKDVLAADYLRAWQRLKDIRGDWHARMAEYDAVILPTCPNLPPKIDDLLSDSALYGRENLLALQHTRIGNLLGISALTLPTGLASCGIMFFGKPGGEESLLRLGKAAETALS